MKLLTFYRWALPMHPVAAMGWFVFALNWLVFRPSWAKAAFALYCTANFVAQTILHDWKAPARKEPIAEAPRRAGAVAAGSACEARRGQSR